MYLQICKAFRHIVNVTEEKKKESLVKKKQKQKASTPETTEELLDEEEEEKDDEDGLKGTEELPEQLSSSDQKMSDSGFTILGGFESKPVQKVSMHLHSGKALITVQF